MPKSVKYKTVVRCPICKYKKEVIMPTDSCVILFECEECQARLRPKINECCIFCSYGSVPCPDAQQEALSKRPSTSGK